MLQNKDRDFIGCHPAKIDGNYVPLPDLPKEVKKGKKGGRYTEDVTKDGRPYRRYF